VLASVADPDCVPLGFGCPSAELFPQTALRRMTASLLNARPHLWNTYSSPPGYPELRRLIARRLQARGMKVSAGEVLLTTGAMEALSLSLRLLLKPGDLVAVEGPTFFGLLNAARQAGAKIIEVPGEPGGGVDPARFAAVCEKHPVRAAVLIPSFANPTGSLMDEDRKREWMKVLQRYDVALVEDDLYGELAWDGRKPTPLCALPRKDQTPNVLVGSFSKTLLPGGRVGYAVARSPWIERLTELKSDSTLANATLPEQLAAECLSSGLFDRHLRRMVPHLQAGVHALREGILRHFPPGTCVSEPRGGFVLWVELPEGTDSLALFHAALKKGISIAPGCLFTLGAGLDRFIRLNGGITQNLERSMATLGRLASH
jgi:DNA-binding transcriptional MocR family regulator